MMVHGRWQMIVVSVLFKSLESTKIPLMYHLPSIIYFYIMNRTAIVIGATGLVGSELVQQLLKDNRFSVVKVFVRRSTGVQHVKLQENIIDFDAPHQWRQQVTGNVL